MKKHRQERIDLTRRRVVQTIVAIPALSVTGCGASADGNVTSALPTSPAALDPTPACDDGDDDSTPAQTEGPYFKSSSPQRASLVEAGMAGTLLTLTGRVLSTSCQPINAAKLDFWQADNAGNYDNSGYTLRGHQFTATDGTFSLRTIVPGLYPGRTRHIHVKVQSPNGPVLTTQLYFPAEPRNATDGIFSSALLMNVQAAADGRSATFDFVLAV
jgi:protocatechuate 3,4-dioxygenase beta subunit